MKHRFAQIESSLAEITALLRSQVTRVSSSSPSCVLSQVEIGAESREDSYVPDLPVQHEQDSRGLIQDAGSDGFPETQAVTRIAPIQVVRQINNMITGETHGADYGNVLDELMNIGIDPDGLGKLLFEG